MTFHTFPEVPFEYFEKESYFWQDHFDESKNILTNLIRYCGFKTLHQDCFLYRWLQEQIRYFKFGGTEEMRKWITVPAGSEFWQKLPTYKMRVSDEQMRKWVELLHDKHAMLQTHCKGPSWNRFYKSSRTDFTRPVVAEPPLESWANKRSINHPQYNPTTRVREQSSLPRQ
jgi:hypothetical protein